MHVRTVVATLAALFLTAALSVPGPADAAATTPAPDTTATRLPAPGPFDARMADTLTAYVQSLLAANRIPGAAVAVVQGGRIVYQHGFGVRRLGGRAPVTPSTLMMTGSLGKSLTTTMIATVVDDGKVRWDTRAVDLFPDFAVQDPAITPKVTIRHLVCNCAGVVRRDVEVTFPNRPVTAEAVIRSLRGFPLRGTFGESFEYNNQMVATGGYLAARAAGGGKGDLYADYVAAMQKRVFDPIGMSNTTFSFQTVRANRDYATPHGRTADYGLTPIPLSVEEMFQPIAPAGAEWSNVLDLGRYLLTQLGRGVTPEGRRVVSDENLEVTWKPAVMLAPNAGYALGWGVLDFRGARLLTHNGGTIGFTTNLTLLPDGDLGVAVLCNAGDADPFVSAIAFRVVELACRQPMEADARYAARERAGRAQAAALSGRGDAAGAGTALGPFVGAWENEALGRVALYREAGAVRFRAGAYESSIRAANDTTFVLWDPPLTSLSILVPASGGPGAGWTLVSSNPDQPASYPFRRAVPPR